jgi:hypothetical protein
MKRSEFEKGMGMRERWANKRSEGRDPRRRKRRERRGRRRRGGRKK